jgi:hypothetical protein
VYGWPLEVQHGVSVVRAVECNKRQATEEAAPTLTREIDGIADRTSGAVQTLADDHWMARRCCHKLIGGRPRLKDRNRLRKTNVFFGEKHKRPRKRLQR